MMSLMTYACIIGINFLAGCIFGVCVSPRSDDFIQPKVPEEPLDNQL